MHCPAGFLLLDRHFATSSIWHERGERRRNEGRALVCAQQLNRYIFAYCPSISNIVLHSTEVISSRKMSQPKPKSNKPYDPRARNRGAPLPLVLLSPVIGGPLSWDVLIFLPLLGLGLALILSGLFVAVVERRGHLIFYSVGGAVVLGGCAAAIVFGRNVPAIPDGDAAAAARARRIDLARPADYPTAPVPPLRGRLTAAGGGPWFRDDLGRRVLLRGINVSGDCKIPVRRREGAVAAGGAGGAGGAAGDLASDPCAGTRPSLAAPDPALSPERDPFFADHRDVTFVGRPFPLAEADVHLSRLVGWGYTTFRLLFTWEAVEHAGPGIYDEEYLDYLVAVIRKCREHGVAVFLDSHQDTWSRFTGGDGAPGWTLEAVGFDLTKLGASGAAYLTPPEDAVPMAWNANNMRCGAGTMWTLFFAGNDFAPLTKVEGEPVQEYLQRHYCAMLGRVAQAVKDEPNVLGFDILNEPSVGFVGTRDAADISPNVYLIGWRCDVWSSILLGAGFTRVVDYFSSFLVYRGRRTLNPDGVCAWRGGSENCVWRQNGVWNMSPSDTSTPELLRGDYFATNPRTGRPVDFQEDYAEPFWRRCTAAVRAHMDDAIIFVEPVLDMTDPSKSERPRLTAEQVGRRGFVWAKHCYDGITLLTCSFHRWLSMNPVTNAVVIGRHWIQRSLGASMARFKEETVNMGGGSPVLIGECGIPFRLRRNQDFAHLDPATCALDNTMRAVEIGLVSCTLWNYTAENTNRCGDGWNGEDLSIFSEDQHTDRTDLNSGGRALHTAIRPYALATAGEPTAMDFFPYKKDKRFIFSFTADDTLGTNETVVFLPRYQYPFGVRITQTAGTGTWSIDWKKQTLIYRHDHNSGSDGQEHSLVITKAPRDSLLRNSQTTQSSGDAFEENL